MEWQLRLVRAFSDSFTMRKTITFGFGYSSEILNRCIRQTEVKKKLDKNPQKTYRLPLHIVHKQLKLSKVKTF
jgi:hypothetical protein